MTLYAFGGARPDVDSDTWIAPGAHVIGNVVIEAGASVWFGSVLRGDNEPIRIGAGTNIQENCVLHTDMGFPLTVGRNCTIGHKAMLHGCTVGEGALVGMGATVLNGAVIGAGSLIGAGALVTEGKDFPPAVLIVGSPAQVKRELRPEERAALVVAASGYQKKMRRYRDGLQSLT